MAENDHVPVLLRIPRPEKPCRNEKGVKDLRMLGKRVYAPAIGQRPSPQTAQFRPCGCTKFSAGGAAISGNG